MADPTKYTPAYSYSGFQAVNPSKPLPADEVDNDFANVSLSVNQTIDALKQVRRSDGKLVNQSVGPDQLSPALTIGFTFTGTWVDGRSYSAGDGVVKDDTFYSARIAHTADVSNAPGNDAYWNELFSLNDIVVTGGMSLPRDSFVGDGVTKDFTLSFTPLSKFNLFVQVGGVVQGTDAYSSNGNTLTFINPPPNGYGIEARGFATVSALVVPEDGSVTTVKLADLAVTTVKLAGGAVTEEKLSAGVQQKIDDNVRTVADITALKAVDTTKYDVAFVQQSGREGIFRFVTGDMSAFVTADAYEALYVKANAIASTAGAWVRQRETPDILVDWAGVVKGSSAEAAANTLKLQAVVDLAALTKSGVCLGVGTIFKDLNPLHIHGGVKRFYGMGNSRWHQLYNGTFYESLSQIALFDTGSTTSFFKPRGISSMKGSGASRDNSVSDSPATVNNSFYRMQTFSNGTSGMLDLTAGILIHANESDNLRLEGFRIFPAHGGAAGLDGYNNWATATNADNWAQNGACDFGIVQDGCAHVYYDDVQAVGHFMRSGILICASDGGSRHAPYTTWAAPYHTRITNCIIEGWKAFAIRGPDKYAILNKTATTITIPRADDNPFQADPTLGLTVLTSAFDGTDVTYTTITEVTFGGQPALQFSGLSVDPTTISDTGYLAPDIVGGGTSHIIVDGGTKIHNMKHPTGRLCYDVALTHALPYPDTCIEMSGLAMVEVQFRDIDMQPSGEVFIHIHEVQDVYFSDCWYERGTSVTWPSGHRTGRVIASPEPGSNTHVPAGHAAGQSYNVLFTGQNIQQSQQADFMPHWHVQQRNEFSGDNGFYEPADGKVPTIAQESTPDNYGTFLRAGVNRRVGLAQATYDRFTKTWNPVFWYEDGTLGDRLRMAKDLIPNVNATWDLGSATLGLENGTFRGILYVTDDTGGSVPAFGTVANIAGTWINAVGAVQASRNNASGIWQRTGTDGQVHQFYRDTTIVGSISVTGAATTYSTTSDQTRKDDEGEFTFAQARAVLDLIAFHNFRWKATGEQDHGVFAQELYAVYPKAVAKGGWFDPDSGQEVEEGTEGAVYNPWGVDYSKLVTVVSRCVQGVMTKQDDIEARLSALEA